MQSGASVVEGLPVFKPEDEAKGWRLGRVHNWRCKFYWFVCLPLNFPRTVYSLNMLASNRL